jgi:hypothetical protein
MVEIVKRDTALEPEEKVDLTCSYVPGTTLKPVRVEIPGLGFKVYDTPGLTSQKQPFNLIQNLEDLKYINFTKTVKPIHFTLKSGKSLWIGGLIRIDLRSVP